ncbi:AAA family ATPase, partial [Microbacterium sp.]|uniref:AAA family ATPase n=1 Tax=Microbacterium sp. TaxID=51671 RepID=UPI002618299E
RPTDDAGHVTYPAGPGPPRPLVAAATTPGNESRPYVLVIDEMNRANLAKVFGELYYLLEYRDQSISLQYSSDSDFRLPKNLFIIGTMNTLDRSISMVDAAIRRRFPFVELHPSAEPVSGVLSAYLAAQGIDDRRARLLNALNSGIDERDLQIGPSYLMKHSAREHSGLERIWKYDILPLLDDHFYGTRTPEQIRAQFGLDALLARLNGTLVGPVDAVLQPDAVVSVDGTSGAEEPADS